MTTHPKRILLAEDSEDDAELTLAALAEHDLANEVVHVRDGVEVLDFLNHRHQFADRPEGNPALLLLDLKMPRVDGLQVLEQIKSDDRFRTIPIVILTSSREESDLVRSYDLGVNAYVVKPVAFNEFIDAVRQLGIFWMLVNETPGGAHSGR